MKRFKDSRQRLEISYAVQEDCKKKKTLAQSNEKRSKRTWLADISYEN